ncbi:MAG: AAA family ATPase, partial [Acidobacteriota bacterium]|nr:AAA family ATPase [Acidobacteriota bacterium]
MYLDFYGLKELPFALTPDPRFIYFTPSHTEAMANLHYGIESGKGLIVVTGEVGTGKTTILRWMMNRLDRTVLVAYLFNPRMSVSEFYEYISSPRLLDVPRWESKSELLLRLGEVLDSRHSRGLRTVLIIDEAHGLSPAVLEEIRLLSNFESDSAKQLQIVLTGQPELRDVLNQPELRQLKQRIALRCQIKPLPDIHETERYIASRLLAAGAERTDIFSTAAVDLIFRCSEGIPRQINNLCDNALLAGYAAGAETISRSIIEEVAETFDMLPRADRGRQMGEEREAPARIFTAAGRAELWSSGAGPGGAGGAQAESAAPKNAPHQSTSQQRQSVQPQSSSSSRSSAAAAVAVERRSVEQE